MAKKYFALVLFLAGCLGSNCQLSTFYVEPDLTNPGYIAAQDSHFVAIHRSPGISNNKLFVFLGGTGSITRYYLLLPELAANLGYHVVSIAYPDTPITGSICALSSDSLCFDKVRQEVCYGTPLSSSVSVDTLNSIYMRLVYLLQYLDSAYPGDSWGQFITGNTPNWTSIVLGGHSQGSGHAMYLAKRERCAGVLMFSGSDDYSIYYQKPAHWEYGSSQTEAGKLYALVSLGDELVTFPEYYKIMTALGMASTGNDTIDVDNNSPPYNNWRMLYTDATPQHTLLTPYHNSTAVDYYTPLDSVNQPLFDPVWTYMLTDVVTTGIRSLMPLNSNVDIYPNPNSGIFNIRMEGAVNKPYIQLYDLMGNRVFEAKLNREKTEINPGLENEGIYFYRISDESGANIACGRVIIQ